VGSQILPQAAEILLESIKTQILKGESLTLMLSSYCRARVAAEGSMMRRPDPDGSPRDQLMIPISLGPLPLP
jgi:hypothetical protein